MILFALTEKYVVVARLAIPSDVVVKAWELAAKPSKLEEMDVVSFLFRLGIIKKW